MIDSDLLRAGRRTLAVVLSNGPQIRGKLLDGSPPWSNAKEVVARHKAQDELQTMARQTVMRHGAALVKGTADPRSWANTVQTAMERYIVAGAQLGAGDASIGGGAQTAYYLQSLFATARQRADALARKVADGLATEKQAAAWMYQTAGGLSRAAFVLGGLEGEDGPVRRILLTESQHCTTCPPKARTYPSLADCELFCGGLPGDGSDQCYGNCNCTIKPASRSSVFRDKGASLVEQGGSHWIPDAFVWGTPS